MLNLVVDGTTLLKKYKVVKKFQLVGSACYHPDPKDVDFLVLLDAKSFLTDGRWAFGADWHLNAGEYSDTDESWGSLRRGDLNLICTVDAEWYERAVVANEVCCALQLQDKGDRIVVYRVVRDKYNAEQARVRRDGSR